MGGINIWAVVVAAGLPSALIAFLFSRLSKKLDYTEQKKTEREGARVQHESYIMELIMVGLTLSQATARAVQNIPDANCNGDMSKALEEADAAKKRYRQFEREQVAAHLQEVD